MSRSMKRKSTGAEWAAAAGQVPLGLTLTPEERDLYRVLAAKCGGSMAELSRKLARWALSQGPERILEILSESA